MVHHLRSSGKCSSFFHYQAYPLTSEHERDHVTAWRATTRIAVYQYYEQPPHCIPLIIHRHQCHHRHPHPHRHFPSVFRGVFVVDPHIDFIWSVGKSTKFERHIGFGEDRLEYEVMDNLLYICVSCLIPMCFHRIYGHFL